MMTTSVFGLLLVSTYFSTVEGISSGIYCYQCSVLPGTSENNTHPSQLCAHFDEGSQFQVFCPYSTMCMKRTTRYKVRNETSVIVKRGCAPQKYTLSTYNYAKNKWQSEISVNENAYEHGCFFGEDNGSPSSPSEFCYCSYHLCNGKSSVMNSMDLYGTIVLGIFFIELICIQTFMFTVL